ncbi:MAG TPA: sulfurtransferase TusA family protein [Acidiferrobacteraceae bacterium]|nr:sulfurtransferase TusA family protein [Acidiferrobacteraceae bacterium]
MSEASDVVVDARGSYCPGPLMETIARIKQAQLGQVLEVWSTDEGSAKDIPQWARKVGHEYLGTERSGNEWRVRVRKSK